ncbi:glycosyltransferase family 9 protein [Alteromonas sp. C1M14]|nr:glycosyltransferase family 9 protein [Alteromonas sp. C1M14]
MRLSAIGDCCHAAALVHRIKTHWPDAQLTWIIGKVEYQLMKTLPDVRFIVFDKKQGKAAIRQLQEAVKDEHFDALLMMQVALRANLASRVIKAKERIGFDWARSKELHWLFANKRVAPHKHAHVLDGFMDFGDALGVPAQQPPQWHIPVPAEAEEKANELAKRLGRYAVISPAASKEERNWLPERYAEVADYLRSKNVAVILCGGPANMDKSLATAILSYTGNINENLVGQTTLHEMLAILRNASLVIAPDTGPAHMATTVGTPVIGLYTHSNPRRTGPYNSLAHVASVYDECIEEQKGKGWEKLPWGSRAKGKKLMSRITTNSVVALVDQLLD